MADPDDAAVPAGGPPAWQQLARQCDDALALSRDVAGRLTRSDRARDLLPLLQRMASLVRRLQEGIRSTGPGCDADTRRRLLRGMELLLAQEEENQQAVRRSGVRLGPVRPYRFSPHRARRQGQGTA